MSAVDNYVQSLPPPPPLTQREERYTTLNPVTHCIAFFKSAPDVLVGENDEALVPAAAALGKSNEAVLLTSRPILCKHKSMAVMRI